MFQDDSLTLPSSGIQLHFKKWHTGPEPVIALHGWLDNSASFDPLAPHLDQKKVSFFAVDLCGHGLSDHLPLAGQYSLSTAVEHVLELTKTLGFESFHLLGHSMGAGIATIVASIIPTKIKSLTLIEGLGPLTVKEKELPERMLHHFKIKFRKLLTEKPRYKNLEEAAHDRTRKSGLPFEASKVLATRGLKKIKEDSYTWATDTRLIAPTAQPLTERNLSTFLKRISSPTQLILGTQSELNQYEHLNTRIELVKNCQVQSFEGGHHIHMEKPESIAKLINKSF